MKHGIKWTYYCYFCSENTKNVVRLKDDKSIYVCTKCLDEGKHLDVEFNKNVFNRRKKNY